VDPLSFRRKLRSHATDAERRLWNVLRDRRSGPKLRRQHSVGRYVLDFYCPEAGLAIEADGGQHFEEGHRKADAERDVFLATQGIRVLRFTDRQILLETGTVREVIWEAVRNAGPATPSPFPSPPLSRGRGEGTRPQRRVDWMRVASSATT
jgi:very-short-patch-repair endonuclease